jgi:mannosyl-glycoprotein endo-beta-N-acetylglucosaminidase
VALLTERMHAWKSDSQVIWYDSVTCDGLLSWQNELNENNESFFDVCDGIFLNYCWKEHNLEASANIARHKKVVIFNFMV